MNSPGGRGPLITRTGPPGARDSNYAYRPLIRRTGGASIERTAGTIIEGLRVALLDPSIALV